MQGEDCRDIKGIAQGFTRAYRAREPAIIVLWLVSREYTGYGILGVRQEAGGCELTGIDCHQVDERLER